MTSPTDWRRARGDAMSNGNSLTLSEIERRMAIVRDNIRQLIEQAAANSGAGDESRNADRIAAQQDELDRLSKERDALLKK
jgi:uncharacterized small protein (DUF1192 family)